MKANLTEGQTDEKRAMTAAEAVAIIDLLPVVICQAEVDEAKAVLSGLAEDCSKVMAQADCWDMAGVGVKLHQVIEERNRLVEENAALKLERDALKAEVERLKDREAYLQTQLDYTIIELSGATYKTEKAEADLTALKSEAEAARAWLKDAGELDLYEADRAIAKEKP